MAEHAAGEDFPLLCETCLGPNPMVRMTRLPVGHKLCKVSELPFQGFRWKAGPGGRFKETVVSYVVAVDRNICQCCLNDLRFGLPVGVRDAMMKRTGNAVAAPSSIVGQQYVYAQKQQELQHAGGEVSQSGHALEMADVIPSRQLDHFAVALHSGRAQSAVAFRNLPKLCSFWLNGKCSRAARKTCPYRPCCGTFAFPEIASDRAACAKLTERLAVEGPDAVQRSLDPEVRSAIHNALRGNRDAAIRSRVAGSDDLSKKYLGKLHSSSSVLVPPDDASVTTLWLGGIDEVPESELSSALYPYGPFVSLRIARAAKCAFVEYPDRASAEHAAGMMHNAFALHGRPIAVRWAKPKQPDAGPLRAGEGEDEVLMAAPPGMEGVAVETYALPNLALPILTPAPSESVAAAESRKRKAEILAELQALDDAEERGPWSQGRLCASKPAEGPRRLSYPSMNPQRLGGQR